MEIVSVLRADKLSHKTFLVRRIGEDQNESSDTIPLEDDEDSLEMVGTTVNDQGTGTGDKLQVMKLFDRSHT